MRLLSNPGYTTPGSGEYTVHKRDNPQTEPTIITRRVLPLLLWTAIVTVPGLAAADQRYTVAGTDAYQVGARELTTHITYNGKETLTITRAGGSTRYRAKAEYTRSDQTGTQPLRAYFDALMLPSGEQRDQANGDPNYLTVLNQPFSVQLDVQTLRDLSRLHGRIPFDFPSPMTGGALHGYLGRGTSAVVGGRRAMGVQFSADGPMRGPLPDHPAMSLNGRMQMRGTAYYQLDTALLLALDATLTIRGNLDSAQKATPVTIVYKRSIRAEGVPVKEAASAKF